MGPVNPNLLAGLKSAYGGRGFMNEPEKEKPMWEKILSMIGGLGMPTSLAGLQSPLLGGIQSIQNIFKQFRPEEQGPMGQNRSQSPSLYNYRRR